MKALLGRKPNRCVECEMDLKILLAVQYKNFAGKLLIQKGTELVCNVFLYKNFEWSKPC